MNPLPECCFPHSAPIPHQFVMKVYVDAWIYVTEKFVNMGNIELYEGVCASMHKRSEISRI